MKSINLEGLLKTRAEIEAQLAPYHALVESLADIDKIIARLKAPPVSTPELPLRPPPPKTAFQPDPTSLQSRVLEETRRILEGTPGRTLAFVDLYRRLPPELNGSGNRRENARNALKRRGKNAGIRYANAHVQLEA